MKNSFIKIPEIDSKLLSVRWWFWERFRHVKDARSLIFFTPASVNPPPQISRDCRFLKATIKERKKERKMQLKYIKKNGSLFILTYCSHKKHSQRAGGGGAFLNNVIAPIIP